MKTSGAFFMKRRIQFSITLPQTLIACPEFFATGYLISNNLNTD